MPDPEPVLEAARAAGVQASLAGHAEGDSLVSPGLFDIQLSALRAANEGWLPAYMTGTGAAASELCGCGEEH